MIGNHAVANRRKPAGADDAGVEQRESTADAALWRQVRDGPIQYRLPDRQQSIKLIRVTVVQ